MGTGKSTVARQLASHFGIDSLDTDRMIESRTQKTVREIFAQSGENSFRDVESEVLEECLHRAVAVRRKGATGR